MIQVKAKRRKRRGDNVGLGKVIVDNTNGIIGIRNRGSWCGIVDSMHMAETADMNRAFLIV